MSQYIGTIALFPYTFVPQGFLACDGRQLPKTENERLAQVLQTTGETITMPKLTAPLPGLTYAMMAEGIYPPKFKTAARYVEALLGTIALQAIDFVPEGWLACEGQLLPIMQNTALFSLLGTTFGGDGKTTYALPDLRGKEPAPGLKYCIVHAGIYPQRP
jgi:microcystin-dependent protein